MSSIFNMFMEGIGDMYGLLDSIPIGRGVSVLDFLIAIVVISVIVPVLITVGSSMYSAENSRIERNIRREENYEWQQSKKRNQNRKG